MKILEKHTNFQGSVQSGSWRIPIALSFHLGFRLIQQTFRVHLLTIFAFVLGAGLEL